MKFFLHVFLMLIVIVPTVAFAEFTYQGKPIAPDCMVDLLSSEKEKHPTVSLSECSSNKKSKKVRYDKNIFTNRSQNEDDTKPFSNYAIIGQYGNKYLIDFGQWTGGSGFFTSIMWIDHQGDKLKLLDVYAGGDRCNGGTEKTGPWQYGVNLTATDLIELAGDKSIKLAPYRDLDSSAAGCVAEAHFSFNPDKATTQFVYVVLDKEMDTTIEWAREFKHQVCLNEIFEAYISKGLTKLDMKGVKGLAEQFRQDCLTVKD